MIVPERQRQEYLDHALEIGETEHSKISEYAEWLPSTIIDAHAHANLPEHVTNIPDKTYRHMMSTFPSFSIEESKEFHNIFHPKTKIRSLRFAHVFRGIDHSAANAYLLQNVSDDDRVALYGLPNDIPYTVDMLADQRVSALKMYYSYLEPSAQHIYDIFKPEILEAADGNNIPIVLHTPKVIMEGAADVLRLKEDFPNLKVSIAHLGSSKFDAPGLQDAYDALAEGTDIVMDTSLNPSADVCLRALSTFGHERILFGSDEPLNLLRSVPYVHPTLGQRITTQKQYHWQDPSEQAEFASLAVGAVHSHWLCLDALKSAIEQLPEPNQVPAKQAVFHDNAMNFFGFNVNNQAV